MNIIDDTYSTNQQSLIEDEDSDRFEFAYDMKQLYRVIHSIPEDMKFLFRCSLPDLSIEKLPRN